MATSSFIVLALAAASISACGSADRGALFSDLPPSEEMPIVAGTGGTTGAPNGSGGALYGSGGAPTPAASGAGGISLPPGSGGAPIAMNPDAGFMPPPVPTTPFDGGMRPPPASSKCTYAGTWGTIIRVPVKWPEAPLVLHGGQGQVLQWNISHRMQDGVSKYHEVTALCGIYLPDLTGSVLANEQKFGIRFPDSLFDNGYIPTAVFPSTTSVVDGEVHWDAGPVSLLTGVLMSDPANTPWPTSFPPSQTPDQDRDGSPGVTVLPVDPATDPSYNWPPVGLPPTLGADYPRASRISVVVRTVAMLHGTVSSCDELRAAVDIMDIDGTPALNSMVIGCTKTTGEVCSQDEANFVNSARPQFTPSGPGTLVSVRLPDSAGCPDVRRALPQ